MKNIFKNYAEESQFKENIRIKDKRLNFYQFKKKFQLVRFKE